ncbi:hypothetical protein BGX21_003328 [Mortierella sp. AD011]|nr:hypothetical protein BGX20_001994 [Mortierella sp. AD010]KAF9403512.1 hypothetical protein BGX21_003328 [Mortierella sp. AD011]
MFEYYSAPQLGSPSLMNTDHESAGCYTRDGCAENDMLQVHFDDSLSLCFLPSTNTIPAAYYTSQYPNSNFDASKPQLQRLQLQQQQYQAMFLQHQWRLLGCQSEFPMQDHFEAPSPIYLPQSNLVPQNHCQSWILQGSMDSHASMRCLSSYAEETIADSPYFNHPIYESPTITQLSSSEASSPELDQVSFEKLRGMSALATVSDNEYYDKLNISATGSTAIELSPKHSPQMTVTECKRYPIKQELADSEPEERVTPKKKERLHSPVKGTGSESKSHPNKRRGTIFTTKAKNMDSPFSHTGFIYDPLHSLGVTTKSSSSTASWPSYESAEVLPLFQEESHYGLHNDISISGSFGSQVENLLLPLEPSTSSTSTLPSLTTPCHPLDCPQDISTITGNTNMFESTTFGRTMIALSSHFDMRQSINLSRSSSTSTMTCIDPAALMLNCNKESSAASSCISTPQSRRHSSFSVNSEIENEDAQHAEMRSLFEENFSLSTTSQSSSSLPTTRACSTNQHQLSTQPFMQDLVLPDGVAYRFDGTSLVPVSRTHYSDLWDNSRGIASPSLNFNTNPIVNHALSAMMLPRFTLTDIIHSGSPALSSQSENETENVKTCRETRGGNITKRPSLKKTSVARRTSLDSISSSSSSSSARLLQGALGRGSSSNSKNGDTNAKYRKDGTGEFQCPYENCFYRYNLRRELNRHRNVHLFAGKDKYRCMNCNSGLCRLDSVKRHMEAKGKADCLKRGLYQEFRHNGELVRVRKCKASWYEAAAANATTATKSRKT